MPKYTSALATFVEEKKGSHGERGRETALSLAQSGPLRVVVGRDADRAEALYKYFLPFTPENTELAETSPFLSFLRMRHPEKNEFREISGRARILLQPFPQRAGTQFRTAGH